jgi:uncharacterized membrane protein YwzB
MMLRIHKQAKYVLIILVTVVLAQITSKFHIVCLKSSVACRVLIIRAPD